MSHLRAITANIQEILNTGAYDQNKTTLRGTVSLRTVTGIQVLSPPPVKWVDDYTDSGSLIGTYFDYTNNRKYSIVAVAAGLASILLHNFNSITGVYNYVGRIIMSFPNSTTAIVHTIHGIKVDDSNTSDIKIGVITTATGNVQGGGLLVTNLVALSDFTFSGTSIPMATAAGQKAVYFYQDTANFGAGNLHIAGAALAIDRTNKIFYCHNGISATHQMYLYDYSVASVIPSSTVTITIATPGVVADAGHNKVLNDVVQFSTTGALPTGIVANTPYYVRNPVAGVSYELTTTLNGAASINTSGSQSGVHSVIRSFGITTSQWKWKTGNLPALTGTLLLTNSEMMITPQHTNNSGFLCIGWVTTTNLYLIKASDFTIGTTLTPSLVTSNILGSTNQTTALTPIIATYDTTFDRFVFSTNTTKIVAKQCINNVIQEVFGVLNNDYLEGVSQVDLYTQFGMVAISDLFFTDGWLMISGSTAGQRGTIATNLGADHRNSQTYLISPVMTFPVLSKLIAIGLTATIENISAPNYIQYRTSGFGNETAGWIDLPATGLWPANTFADKLQIRSLPNMAFSLTSNPEFIIDMFIGFDPIYEMSDNWEGSVDNSSQSGNSPMYVAFRQLVAYGVSVPQLSVRGYDDAGILVASYDTVTNASQFSYTTNNGVSWNPLGTIPNVPYTTELRLLVSSPPVTSRITWMIEES